MSKTATRRCAGRQSANPIAGLDRRSILTGTTTLAAAAIAGSAFAVGAPAAASDEGTVWWSEFLTAHPDRAREFYAAISGWTPKIVALDDPRRPPAAGEAEYTIFTAFGQEVAGLMKLDETDKGLRPGWLTYIQVKNVDLAVAAVVAHGGKVLRAAVDVAGVARIAIVEDPDAYQFGLATPL